MGGWLVPLNLILGFVWGFVEFILLTPVVHAVRWLGDKVPESVIHAIRAFYSVTRTVVPHNFWVPTYSDPSEAIRLGVVFGLVMGLACGIGMLVGILTALLISRGFIDFTGAFEYVKAMLWPVIGFFVGYSVIWIIFAGMYGSIARLDPRAFHGVNRTTDFLDFTFFSLMTLTTLGYSPIVPVSAPARTVAAVQATISVVWVVVVFAAVIAYVEPRFRVVREHTAARENRGPGSGVATVIDSNFLGVRNGLVFFLRHTSDIFRRIGRRLASPAPPRCPVASQDSPEEGAGELPNDDTSGVAVSFPNVGIDRVSYDVEGRCVRINLSLTESRLWFTLQDVVVSTGPRPRRTLASLRRMGSKGPRRAKRFTVVLPLDGELRGVGYQYSGNYLHIVLQGPSGPPKRERIWAIVDRWAY